MKSLVTVSNALIVAILEGAPLSETDKQRLLDEAGLDAARVRDITARTSIVALSRLWRGVLRVTGDNFIGLEIGRAIRADRFGLAAHTATNSPEYRLVLNRFCRFAGLINDAIVASLEEDGDLARLRMEFRWDLFDLERHAVDITFAATVKWSRERLADRYRLREVRFKHALVGARERCLEHFGVPVVLGACENALVFDRRALDGPIPDANADLGVLLDRYATLEVSRMPVLHDLPSRISQVLIAGLQRGARVDLPHVCEALGMAPRNLQRQLAKAATSFSALLDDARRVLAPAMLAEEAANVEQVGFQLGYSEPTAFIRAFKKWYAVTPGQYRKSALGPGAQGRSN